MIDAPLDCVEDGRLEEKTSTGRRVVVAKNLMEERSDKVGVVLIWDKGGVGRIWAVDVVGAIQGVGGDGLAVDINVAPVRDGITFDLEHVVVVVVGPEGG